MWPWSHFAVAYLAVSVVERVGGRRVDGGVAAAALLGSQFPDLVDKPLSWGLAVLPTGTSLAHSVFVAVPACLAVWFVADRRGHGRLGVAFAVGYLLHLPGDVLYGTILTGQPPSVGILLWPVVPQPATDATGLFGETLYYVGRFREFLSRPAALRYVLLEATLLLATLAAWYSDGRPGVEALGTRLSGVFSRR